ncbi:DUF3717 domain-containing protein [Burkholderia contaminans]|uniref:DUF3717 domain-containing protein n=1 Tax=Burkholderia contaminans TaxID=488447 RepID=UPI001F1383F4|nr:DUF3717 domain-containing protein [Burkholderia contaminans]UMY33455.1 DUF3717 domain-containing protein [Burkholderia contaminans]
MIYSIGEVETAINIWRTRLESGDDAALCAPARALAEPYGLMVYEGRDTITDHEMTAKAREAMAVLVT